ncbi:hypothetical protein NG798_21950 [Ancylothrix sp. C2]|nr:hypothetical protein [Ancylothrix sp. D3o]
MSQCSKIVPFKQHRGMHRQGRLKLNSSKVETQTKSVKAEKSNQSAKTTQLTNKGGTIVKIKATRN